jgi:hypothetical protein
MQALANHRLHNQAGARRLAAASRRNAAPAVTPIKGAGAWPKGHSFRATSGPVMRARRGKVPTMTARAATIPAAVSV